MLKRTLGECEAVGISVWRRFLSDVKVKKDKLSKEEVMKKKTPKGKLDEPVDVEKPYEDPYLPRHPGGVNPITGEIGGPAGPEPTRYGDWERKGRVSDF
uniref:Succinate dehydrogenase assembly factor 4, mitochondrial n=1 Tax=Ascaris lumbricoides TaxID=6252 RepID=A0A0M3HET0_ASCLU